jgi:hypothetical protein
MRFTKIKINSLLGISELELGSKSVELKGKNGVGKTSVLDAIKYALTNNSEREYVIRQGSTEGEILIETDSGLRINRKPRTNAVDYKSVKQDGREVGSPEAFLKGIFTELQLNPVEFMSMSKKEQSAIILDMIEYPWNLAKIKEWFGEIPSWVAYEQNILAVLNDIQSDKGQYFIDRHDIGVELRNKRAFIEEIGAGIPTSYDVTYWENASAGEIYTKIERIRKGNQTIEKAKQLKESRDNKVRAFEADKEIATSALDREFNTRSNQLEKNIQDLYAQIATCQKELEGLTCKKQDKLTIIEQTYKANVAKYDAEITEYEAYLDKEPQSTDELEEEVTNIEKMQKHINEYRRMQTMQREVENLTEQSQLLTEKIEKARTLPGEILANCTIPIQGLTVENGLPLINGLPVSNLSEGEKLDLCIDVAIQKPNGLQIILIDGVEKLATTLREQLYAKCKDKGLQFIATRTTDDDEMIITEL